MISKLLLKIQIPAITSSKLDNKVKIGSKSHIVNSFIEKYSYTGNNCTIVNTQIGKFCSIANNVVIGGAEHPINWVSSSPVFHNGKNIFNKNFSDNNFKTNHPTFIGNDVWIGNNCLIKSGVSISDGAVIGMGSVVTKDVGPFEIWAGNPAKFLKKRFSEHEINELIKLEWWNYPDKKLENLGPNFNRIEKIIDKG